MPTVQLQLASGLQEEEGSDDGRDPRSDNNREHFLLNFT